MTKRRNYEELGDIELSPEEDQKVTEMIEAAEQELEATRVSFRWNKESLQIVKLAAELIGVPYQTFMKQVVFEHAIQVLKDAKELKNSTDAA